MARGQAAKEYVINKLREAFGEDFIQIYDKKVYVWGREDGSKMQVCISMTCPKTPIGEDPGGVLDFSDTSGDIPVVTEKKAEIDKKELDEVAAMMARLGL